MLVHEWTVQCFLSVTVCLNEQFFKFPGNVI
jgi:hypothetical protein